jgi:hypothetical protein
MPKCRLPRLRRTVRPFDSRSDDCRSPCSENVASMVRIETISYMVAAISYMVAA